MDPTDCGSLVSAILCQSCATRNKEDNKKVNSRYRVLFKRIMAAKLNNLQ